MRDAWAPLQQMPTAITFFGHTHVQGGFSQKRARLARAPPRFTLRRPQLRRTESSLWTLDIPPGTRHLINPGSVGQPRDRDWRAAFAIYDSGQPTPENDDITATITFHRVPYDLVASQGRILMAGLPERLAARLREGR